MSVGVVGEVDGCSVGEMVGIAVGRAKGDWMELQLPEHESFHVSCASTRVSIQLVLDAQEMSQCLEPHRIRVLPLHASSPLQVTVTSVADWPSMRVLPSHELDPLQLMMHGSPARHSSVASLHCSLPMQLRVQVEPDAAEGHLQSPRHAMD